MKPTLLIDADLIAYRTACKFEQKFEFGDDFGVSYDEDGAIQATEDFVDDLCEKFNPGKVIFCFSGEANFRYDVLPTYKHNRRGKPKPKLFWSIKEYCEAEYPWLEVPNLEADDVLGIYGSRDPDKYIVCSGDKDLKTVPCTLHNFLKDTTERISEDRANYWFFYQTLIGDSTDGYKGCPLVGPKKAEKFLADVYDEWDGDLPYDEYVWKAIVERYEAVSESQAMKAYGVYPLTEEIALQQARVARILRDGEYDFDTQEVKLWKP